MVKSAYSSGKPALGVGPGNTPAIIDETADINLAVNSIIHSKTFDNGMICASEQSVIIDEKIYEIVRQEFISRGCYVLNSEEADKLRKTIIINGSINAKIVGQTANTIAKLAEINVPENNTFAVFFLQALPLVLIMISLFIIAFVYSRKAVILNNVYMNNEVYSKKYNYLMTSDEYLSSASRKKRIIWYNMTNLKKEKGFDE